MAAFPPSDAELQQALAKFGGHFGTHLEPAHGLPAGIQALYRRLQQQAVLLSFIGIFRWSALVAGVEAIAGWAFHKVGQVQDAEASLH